ncbi:flavodoxin family protein [Deltaproteobacteria bacterium OttesenSCG-928-M10]|nr:flavodoxin family protein [Deltaproteobacteria bacterium OttesenSCG-928-M10]
MTKSAAIILSSPRKGANSSALALAMGAGIEEAGGSTSVVDLSGLEVKPCLGCEACQRNGGKCVQLDGMQTVYPKVAAADILVLATPVYWFNVSGQLKVFLDRCFAVAVGGEGSFGRKTIAAALAFGDTDPFTSGGVNAIRSIQDICNYSGAVWGGCVYGSAMERDVFSQDQELLERARTLGKSLVR